MQTANVTVSSDYETTGDLKSSAISKVGALKYDIIREDSDNYGDGSWANKEIEIYLADGSLLGIMNLNSNSWTNTWDANGGTETSEGYNFNDAKWNFLGGGHYNSDGWVNENSRIDVMRPMRPMGIQTIQ